MWAKQKDAEVRELREAVALLSQAVARLEAKVALVADVLTRFEGGATLLASFQQIDKREGQ